jgi:methylthioribose-1-phosphate isomerase
MTYVSIKFSKNRLFYIDQTKLPLEEKWLECKNLNDGYSAIKNLNVRGAPLIGIFAAYVIIIHLKSLPLEKSLFLKEFKRAIAYLKGCRPTAVNLAWALQRLETLCWENQSRSVSRIKEMLAREARLMHREDISLCDNMAAFGAKLISDNDRVLTHCNTGFLATAGKGTALAVIYQAKKDKKNVTVYVDETRPLLQGARLTAWELMKNKITAFVICDNSAAYLMRKGLIDKVFVGADRIAANGDVANKIGTYSAALAANFHKIPFYVVAPFTTFDLSLASGGDIPIEQRPQDEVRLIMGSLPVVPKKAKACNFAFDLTPHDLITAIVSDKGIIYPPYKENIKKIMVKIM